MLSPFFWYHNIIQEVPPHMQTARPYPVFVTVSGKIRHIAIFAKIAIALYLSSVIFELTLLQVWDQSPAPFPGYSALCPTMRELLNSRNYSLKVLLCAHIRSPYTTKRMWVGRFDLMKRANAWRRERQGYDLRQRLSADCSKRAPVGQFNWRTRRL